jgi:predicted component of viral defense system (DUF524 family)
MPSAKVKKSKSSSRTSDINSKITQDSSLQFSSADLADLESTYKIAFELSNKENEQLKYMIRHILSTCGHNIPADWEGIKKYIVKKLKFNPKTVVVTESGDVYADAKSEMKKASVKKTKKAKKLD